MREVEKRGLSRSPLFVPFGLESLCKRVYITPRTKRAVYLGK